MARVSLKETPLAGPEFLREVMATVMECDFLPRITESHAGEIRERDGKLFRLMTTLEVGPFKPFAQGSGAPPPSRQPAVISELAINNLTRLDLEFRLEDLSSAFENRDWFYAELKEAVYQSFVSCQREWVLTRMMEAAPPSNKGNSAGPKVSLRLGSPDEPLTVSPGKIMAELSKLRRVLVESESWRAGRMWLVVPLEFYTALAATDLGNVVLSGPTSAVDGELPNTLMGFRVFVTGNPPFDAAEEGSPILAGHRGAFVYSAGLTETGIVEIPDFESEILRLTAAHGGEAARPEALALACWKFDLDGD